MYAFRKPLVVLVALAALLAACAPAQSIQGPQEVQAQIATSVALTVAAQNTETAGAQPTATLTFTPTSVSFLLPTLTPILPTPTPFVVVPPSPGGGGGGGGVQPTKGPQYACGVVAQSPEDGTTFKSGDPFDVKWTIKNIGTKTWDASYSFSYFKGEDMSDTPSMTLGTPVKPGKTITLTIEANAPIVSSRDPQLFIMWWAIKGEGSRFCTPYIAIYAKKPGT